MRNEKTHVTSHLKASSALELNYCENTIEKDASQLVSSTFAHLKNYRNITIELCRYATWTDRLLAWSVIRSNVQQFPDWNEFVFFSLDCK